MERRDYLEREIEKLRAVLQKIFRLRVDKPEAVQEAISVEMTRFFDIGLTQLVEMEEDEFYRFMQGKNIAVIELLGELLFASVNLNAVSATDRLALQKTLLAWEIWEAKAKTLDLAKREAKENIKLILTASTSSEN